MIYGSWRRCDKGSSCMSAYAFFFPCILSDLGQDSVTILESLRGQTSRSYSRHQCTRCSRSHGDVNSLLLFFSPPPPHPTPSLLIFLFVGLVFISFSSPVSCQSGTFPLISWRISLYFYCRNLKSPHKMWGAITEAIKHPSNLMTPLQPSLRGLKMLLCKFLKPL